MIRSKHISWHWPSLAAVMVCVFAAEIEATPPQKPVPAQYNGLVTRSPFTIRPVISSQLATSSLERDWMLGSIRPDESGWRVTLINKKDRNERVRLIPGFHAGGFQLLEVKQDPGASENSKVRVRKGSQTAWIGYDEKLVKLRPASNKINTASQKPAANTKATVNKPPIPGQTPTTKPRTRYVPKIKR